mgnify:CR=1 FL=1
MNKNCGPDIIKYFIVESGSTGSNFTTVSYTSSNILNNDLVTVLPTPNPNEYYQISGVFKYVYGTTPYIVGGFDFLQLNNVAGGTIVTAPIPTGSSNEIITGFNVVTELGQPLTMDLRVGVITGGDGFVNVEVNYELLTF